MIKAKRMIIEYNLTYENVELYSSNNIDSNLKFFEEDTILFSCKDGEFIVPRYCIILLHFKTGKITPPKNSILIKRLTLNYETTHQNAYVIDESNYYKYDIPMVFEPSEQFVFSTHEGMFITSDKQVILAQIK